MKISLRVGAAVALASFTSASWATVNASLDRDQVTVGESVQLTLQRNDRGGGEPELGPLKKDFDILGTSTGSSIQFVNGHFSEERELRVNLVPKHAGKLQVPPLTWDREQSIALELTVADSAAGLTGGTGDARSSHVFLTSTLDQKEPYVQGTVMLTVQLHTDQALHQATLDFTGSNDVSVQQIGKDQQSRETRGGRSFDVVERKYLLLPQRSGTLSLDGPTLDAEVADSSVRDPFGSPFGNSPFAGMMGGTRPLRLHGDPIQLNVRPRPASATGRDWLPARHITLEQAWKPDSPSLHAGEPLTLHLRLAAEGLTGAQLPDLSTELSLPDDVKAYPDQGKLDTSLQSGDVVGSREQDIALIANRAGHYVIPSLRLSWWDITQDVQREVVLPEHSVDILPSAGVTNDTTSTPSSNPVAALPSADASSAPASTVIVGKADAPSSTPWRWVSLGLAVLWLATLLGWWRQRLAVSRPLTTASEKAELSDDIDASAARKAFRQACRDNDAKAARRNLLAWARASWGPKSPSGLNALAARLGDSRLAILLRELDRSCYSDGTWHGEALASSLTALPLPIKARRKGPELADLYR